MELHREEINPVGYSRTSPLNYEYVNKHSRSLRRMAVFYMATGCAVWCRRVENYR